MTFLAPWALVVGALAAVGLVALHLVARQRPAAYPLPTARFVPDRRTLVSRVATRPRDLLLLLLRVTLVLNAAAAFARPVLRPRRSARARVLVLDRSAAVADGAEAVRRAREIASDGVLTRVIMFDSAVTVLDARAPLLDSLERAAPSHEGAGGLVSAMLAAARRVGAELGARADSVELVLVTPLTERELDAASDTLRALWPGGVRLVRLVAMQDTISAPPLERGLGRADVLGPALGTRGVSARSRGVRLLRTAPAPADSAYARAGGVVVRWDSIGARTALPSAVAMGDVVVVAALGRGVLAGAPAATDARVLARWADGTPAAVEWRLGEGCLREVAIGIPVAGDLPLSSTFRRLANGLTDGCAGARAAAGEPVDSARAAALSGRAGAAAGSALASGAERPTPIAPWLLGLALACALAELLLRGRRDAAEAANVAEAAGAADAADVAGAA